MAVISAQGATLTYGGVVMERVADYDVQYTLRNDDYGTIRIRAIGNNAVTPEALSEQKLLTIRHVNNVRTFEGWVLATGVSVSAVTNDIVRYQFDFRILSLPYVQQGAPADAP